MKRTSLTFLLPAVFFVTLCLFLGGYAAFVVSHMRGALVNQAVNSLDLASERGAWRVRDWFADAQEDVLSASNGRQTRDAITQRSANLAGRGEEGVQFLVDTYVAPNTGVDAARAEHDYSSDRSFYGQNHARIHDFFRAQRREHDYHDIYLFDTSGQLIYTVMKKPDLGLNALSGPLSELGLGSAFRRAFDAATPTVVFEDFSPYPFSNQSHAGFLAVQVLNDRGEKIGVLAIQLSVRGLSQTVLDNALDGRAYDFTLIGADGASRINRDDVSVGQTPPLTAQIEAGLRGETGIMEGAVNAAGTSVFAAYLPITLSGARWILVTELEMAGVMAPVWHEVRLATLAVVALGILALLVGRMIGNWLARPLADLTEVTTRLMAYEDVTIGHLDRRDEIGELARGFERVRLDQVATKDLRRKISFKGKAFDTTKTAMMIADAEGTLLYVNEALTDLFRSNSNSMMAQFPTMDIDRLVGTNISIFHSNHDRVMTMLRDPKNAQIAPDVQIGPDVFGLSVSAVDDEDGARAGYVVVWEDVRELRRVKAVISAVETGQVLMELAPDGTILTINQRGSDIYGYPKDEIIGKPLSALLKNGDAEMESVLEQVLAMGSLTEHQHHVARDGSDRFAFANMNILLDKKGNPDRIVALYTDQTRETQFRRAAEVNANARNRDLAEVVERLREALIAMAQGDLSRTIDQPFSEEYDSLRQNCNAAIEGLSSTLTKVSAVADRILSGADGIATAAVDLSRRTESQASTLEQTAAALDTLTSNVRQATEGTMQAGKRVTSAHGEADANGSVVRQAIDAMKAIEASSNQITKILSVIDDIAFQTSLLALNAGVEAARAGDAGRGFAVVAAEVRALAQRSSEAAREIKSLISTSEAQVTTGADLVNQSGRAVEAIVGDVAEISRIVNTISQSSQDQANGLAEINAGVVVLDKVTQQNAAMVEQSTAASTALKQEAGTLADLLAAFKLVGAAGHTSSKGNARHAA